MEYEHGSNDPFEVQTSLEEGTIILAAMHLSKFKKINRKTFSFLFPSISNDFLILFLTFYLKKKEDQWSPSLPLIQYDINNLKNLHKHTLTYG